VHISFKNINAFDCGLIDS